MTDYMILCGLLLAGSALSLAPVALLLWLRLQMAEALDIVPPGTTDNLIAATIDPPQGSA